MILKGTQRIGFVIYGLLKRIGVLNWTATRILILNLYYSYKSIFEWRNVLWLRMNLPSNCIVIDVGSALAFYSLVMSSKRQKRDVIGFEPDEWNRESSELAIRLLKAKSLKVLPLAVSNEAGFLSLRRDFFNPANNSVEKSVGQSEQVVTATTIDSEFLTSLKPIGFVKIDIQGHELEALQGGIKVISKYRPGLMIEFDSANSMEKLQFVWDLMQTLNYKGFIINRLLKLKPLNELVFSHSSYFDVIYLPQSE